MSNRKGYGTKLLWVKNTTSQLLLDTATSSYYVLLSGRWFRARAFEGPWEFVPADKLPADFAKVPETHPRGDVLSSVFGTPQAQEALIANGVPQTAAIKRSEAKIAPVYDGKPQLQPVEGTPLQYVVNTPTPIIQAAPDSYFALENGVWFTAGSLDGPWAAAVSVPEVIYTIPTSSPIWYTTNVYVYGSTPEYVYVGCTPGYFGTCMAPWGTVVYGTGWNFKPWIGTAWYGRPWTYGWGARFGWTAGGFGFGFTAADGAAYRRTAGGWETHTAEGWKGVETKSVAATTTKQVNADWGARRVGEAGYGAYHSAAGGAVAHTSTTAVGGAAGYHGTYGGFRTYGGSYGGGYRAGGVHGGRR